MQRTVCIEIAEITPILESLPGMDKCTESLQVPILSFKKKSAIYSNNNGIFPINLN